MLGKHHILFIFLYLFDKLNNTRAIMYDPLRTLVWLCFVLVSLRSNETCSGCYGSDCG